MTLNCLHPNSILSMSFLKFSQANGKLSKRLIFSLPAGYTCPNAGVCKTFADRTTGKIKDLPQLGGSDSNEYRCFAAMAEVRPNVRNARWYNWDLLRNVMYASDDHLLALTTLIFDSLEEQPPFDLTRVHESGEFWTELYMRAWFEVAKQRPQKKFYAYTKSLGMWINLQEFLPPNFYLTASKGGTLDYLIPKYPNVFKRIAHVVYTETEAEAKGLEIDHDDSHCLQDKPFALLVHNSQRAGSEASKALSQRKKDGGFVGYGKTHKPIASTDK